MKTPIVAGALVVVGVVSCGSTQPSGSTGEPVARTSSEIQGGSNDTTHDFAVGVVQNLGGQIALCSGVLLAPNLVATARHCVSRLTSSQIDCATSAFTSTVPASAIFVTTLPTVPMTSTGYYSVAPNGILVPTDTGVCGNDIALLILNKNIPLPQYVTPAINPPMTDHHAYTTSYAAIGYGVDTPTDTNGASAGTRRIKENINLTCIPKDTTFVDCFSFANANQFIFENEFEGGDGTCEGDSGSGAFDQGSFNAGTWVAFGVLSRGGVSAEGGACLGGIYTRFDKWASLVTQAAAQAAALGGYTAPGWAGPSSSPPPAEAGSMSSSDGAAPACRLNGRACLADTDCCSVNCQSFDNGATYTCIPCDAVNTCASAHYGCQQGVCVDGARSSVPIVPMDSGASDAGLGPPRVGGCAAIAASGSRTPWGGVLGLFACTAAVALRRLRARARAARLR